MAHGRTAPLLLSLGLCTLSGAAASSRPTVDDQVRVTLPGTVHRRLAQLAPVRTVDPDFPMARMMLVLKLDPSAKADLDRFLKDQQDPASPSYHQWLTPEAFGKRFGPSQAQVDAAALWLLQQGFTLDKTSRSGLTIIFSGTAGQVAKAFRTAIAEYQVDGVTHHGNVTDLSIPKGLAGFVHGVASLNDLRPHASPKLVRPLAGQGTVRPHATNSNGQTFIAPADFATIYNLTPLLTAPTPIDGTGVVIGVVGETDIHQGDFATFRNTFNLVQPGGQLEVVNPGNIDPGFPDPGELSEASLDTQWASATAPGASIKLVIFPSSATTGGVDLSAEYLVDNNIAPIISYSYGLCEKEMGASYAAMYEQLWAQAAGQGISVFVSSGDSGAAACDDPGAFSGSQGKGVSGFSSTPYNTCVGGTMFTGTGSPYWNPSTTQTNLGTALQYVPEAAWNECAIFGEYYGGGSRILGGGGGASTLYAKPTWQVGPGVPADGMRDVPDVAFNAASFTDPTAVFVDGEMLGFGGTSVATPCMAGIMALVVQNAGGRQGNANPTLYSLANAQYAGSPGAHTIFHDITAGDNSVPGLTGFAAGAGYDQATGLGSLDATALVKNWVPGANPISVLAGAPTGSFTGGSTLTFSGSATDSASNPTLSYLWTFGDGSTASGASTTHTYYLNGPQAQTFTAHLTVTDQNGNAQTSAPLQVPITSQGVSVAIAMPVTSSIVMPGTANPIAFTAGSATTLNAGATIASYEWDIYNPETLALVYSAQGPATSFAFPATSNYGWPVQLTVTDSLGNQGQAWIYVYATTQGLDQNGDGVVDVRDLLALASFWGNAQGTATNRNGLSIAGDLDANGKVEDTDLLLWESNFTPVAP